MANLSIPFILFQPSLCTFTPNISQSKLIPYNKYTLSNPTIVSSTTAKSQNPLTAASQSNFRDAALSSKATLSPFDDT